MISDLEPTGLFLTLSYNNSILFSEITHCVLGAYITVDDGFRHVMVLYRNLGNGFTNIYDSIGRIGIRDEIEIGNRDDNLYLLDEDWPTFRLLKEGDTFRLGVRTWRKMNVSEITPFVNKKLKVTT